MAIGGKYTREEIALSGQFITAGWYPDAFVWDLDAKANSPLDRKPIYKCEVAPEYKQYGRKDRYYLQTDLDEFTELNELDIDSNLLFIKSVPIEIVRNREDNRMNMSPGATGFQYFLNNKNYLKKIRLINAVLNKHAYEFILNRSKLLKAPANETSVNISRVEEQRIPDVWDEMQSLDPDRYAQLMDNMFSFGQGAFDDLDRLTAEYDRYKEATERRIVQFIEFGTGDDAWTKEETEEFLRELFPNASNMEIWDMLEVFYTTGDEENSGVFDPDPDWFFNLATPLAPNGWYEGRINLYAENNTYQPTLHTNLYNENREWYEIVRRLNDVYTRDGGQIIKHQIKNPSSLVSCCDNWMYPSFFDGFSNYKGQTLNTALSSKFVHGSYFYEYDENGSVYQNSLEELIARHGTDRMWASQISGKSQSFERENVNFVADVWGNIWQLMNTAPLHSIDDNKLYTQYYYVLYRDGNDELYNHEMPLSEPLCELKHNQITFGMLPKSGGLLDTIGIAVSNSFPKPYWVDGRQDKLDKINLVEELTKEDVLNNIYDSNLNKVDVSGYSDIVVVLTKEWESGHFAEELLKGIETKTPLFGENRVLAIVGQDDNGDPIFKDLCLGFLLDVEIPEEESPCDYNSFTRFTEVHGGLSLADTIPSNLEIKIPENNVYIAHDGTYWQLEDDDADIDDNCFIQLTLPPDDSPCTYNAISDLEAVHGKVSVVSPIPDYLVVQIAGAEVFVAEDGTYWQFTDIQADGDTACCVPVPLKSDIPPPPSDDDCDCTTIEVAIPLYITDVPVDDNSIPFVVPRPYYRCVNKNTQELYYLECDEATLEAFINGTIPVPNMNGLSDENCECDIEEIWVEQTFYLTETFVQNAPSFEIIQLIQECEQPTNPWGNADIDCEDLYNALVQSGRYPGIEKMGLSGFKNLGFCR